MPAGPGADSPRCRHCHQRAARVGRNGSRGLCNVCYADKAVRSLYPAGKKAKRAKHDGPCLACQRSPATRARRLCHACYADRAVRERHPAALGHGYEGQRKRPGRRLPAEPTDALPGSEEKIRVLEGRASRGEQLHHPGDAKLERDAPVDLALLGGVQAKDLPERSPRRARVIDEHDA